MGCFVTSTPDSAAPPHGPPPLLSPKRPKSPLLNPEPEALNPTSKPYPKPETLNPSP